MSKRGGQQPPAWSGKPKQSGASGPLPPGFEQVNGLGSVVHVSEHQGMQVLPSFGPSHVHLLVRYQHGLAYLSGGNEVHTLPWPEVAVITSNITQRTRGSGAYVDSYHEHEYTLTRTNGDQLILDDGLKDVGEEAWQIKQAVFALLRPAALQRYKAGEALSFGPVTIQQQSGLQLEGQSYAWDAIANVQVSAGQLKVTLSSGKHHEARVSAIPNVELLGQIIGVHFDPVELAHPGFF